MTVSSEMLESISTPGQLDSRLGTLEFVDGFPSPETTELVYTTVTFGPERPADTPEGNWIQTTEGKGWFAILRLYSPLQPYFDKSWRPSEIEPVG